MLKRIFPALLASAFCTPALLAGILPATAAEIRIGIAVPLSGAYAILGRQIVTGAEFAAGEINAGGGIGNMAVAVDAVDDKCDEETAPAIANQLIGKGVAAVIGHLCDRPSIEGSAVYSANKVVQISPASQNPAFTENRPLATGGTYRLAARNTQQVEILTKFMTEKAAGGKIAVVNDGSVYGKGLADAIVAGLNAANIKPVFVQDFESGEERYRTLSARIADSGAALVFIGALHTDSATLIRDIDRLTRKIAIVGGDGLVHADFPELVLGGNENRTDLDNIFASFPPDPRRLASAEETAARFRAAGIKPDGLVLRGYSAMKILQQAIEIAKGPNFDAINKALNETAFETPLGPVEFDGKGDAALVDYAMHRWKNGTIIPINEP